ncbi:MAG: hypothetical protein PHW69_06665 [Elusimicrobiaceae bacterium]|nr:hypothetical protein [Elusimicrobiaceae bacterium]
MLIWILRFFAVAGAPLLTYYLISPDWRGLTGGLVCGLLLVAIEMLVESINLMTIIIGIVGAIMGLVVSKFMDMGMGQLQSEQLLTMWTKYHPLTQFLFIMLGLILAVRKSPELDDLDRDLTKIGKQRGKHVKVIDTSAIIDGRILDICDTHWLSDTVVVPRFVLTELHTLADSQDGMKRARGRRGLDILARLQENTDASFKVLEKDIPGLSDVDSKVIRLASEMGAQVISTDFNMNKMASLEGVVVLNINDLSTALKPVVLPGENMTIFVMKEGKEKEQGVGYLDDGTMVVVEEGRKWIGKRIEASVYSILQTSAGRMIFVKARGKNPEIEMEDPQAKQDSKRTMRHDKTA